MAQRWLSLADRFWSKVDQSGGPDSCWTWTAARDPSGYGKFGLGQGKTVNSHRQAFELANGRKPYGLVCHSCDNRPCVNPKHLSEGSHSSNRQECVERGRNGPRKSKLSAIQMTEIRHLCGIGMSQRKVAKVFGIGHHTVGRVLKRES